MRIGFFGGSFDPPHNGHLAVARAALSALHLDRVLWSPAGLQPMKPLGSSASFRDRCAMVELAIAGEPAFELTRIEAPSIGVKPSYTMDALEALHTEYPPPAKRFLLLGADAFRGLGGWRRAAEIPLAADLIVAARPGEDLSDLDTALPAGWTCEPGAQSETLRTFRLRDLAGGNASLYLLPGVHAEISATELREALHASQSAAHAGKSLDSMLPPAVARYIREHGLYRQ